jgi:8-oxo-dGTP pyrophosphatase MutT (NUDIX family)
LVERYLIGDLKKYSIMPITDTLSRLYEWLPLHAEEGRLRESIAEDVIVSKLSCPDAVATIAVMRRIFVSFSLLDKHELSLGNWAFVSFSASLMARSLTAAWAIPEQRFVDEGYWEDSSLIEEQRILLHQLETGRKQYHPLNNAMPIRFVYVAWAIIRLGDNFLLHHREDRHRSEAKQYVLPGGRLRPSDYRGNKLPAEVLKDLSSESPCVAREALPTTLIREIEEELSLQNGIHYTFEPWRSIKPYCAVEGGGNKHALTRYEITLFFVKLTPLGETCLLTKIFDDPKQLLFFTLNELIQGKRPDGTTAFIDALHQDMGGKLTELFGSIPDSSGTPYTRDKAELAIDLPSSKDMPFLCGKTGKERETLIPLGDFEWELILFLGWCARGFSLRDIDDCVLILGGGWVKLLNEDDVNAAKETSVTLAKMGLPLLQFSGDVLRLASKPEYTYFSDSLFSYAYVPSKNEGGQIDLYLKEQITRFAVLVGQHHRFSVPRNLAIVIETIHEGMNTSDVAAIRNAEKSIQKQNLDTVTKEVSQLGLRRLIKMLSNAEMNIVLLDRLVL